jgi:hypothetical protein
MSSVRRLTTILAADVAGSGDVTGGNLLELVEISGAHGHIIVEAFWSDNPQANRLGSLLTIGHVNSDALGLC